MYRILNAFLLLLLLVPAAPVAAALPPGIPSKYDASRVNAEVRCTVRLLPDGVTTRYSYGIKSSMSSQQQLAVVVIVTGSPLTLVSEPTGWHGMPYELERNWGWGANNKSYYLSPGGSIVGLIVNSRGLPGIVACYAVGKVPMADVEDMPFGMSEDEFNDALDAYRNSQPLKTIGPTSITASATRNDLLAYLKQQLQTATSLGYVDNQGVAQSLNQKLDNTQAAIDRGNPVSASNLLQAFRNETVAQSGRHITSDVSAMLGTIAEIIQSKL